MLSSIDNMAETQLGLLPTHPVLSQGRQGKLADLKDAAHEFEAYFISNLLKVMRETVPKGALDNKGGAYFYSFYDQEIGRLASEAGGIGLARMIHEYTERNAPSLKFSEPVADTVFDEGHRPISKGQPE
jgi:flagellar protein FlgJ